jgi:hypothetical protein
MKKTCQYERFGEYSLFLVLAGGLLIKNACRPRHLQLSYLLVVFNLIGLARKGRQMLLKP